MTLVVSFCRESQNEVPERRNDVHRLSDHRTGSWPGCTSVLRSCVVEFSRDTTDRTITKTILRKTVRDKHFNSPTKLSSRTSVLYFRFLNQASNGRTKKEN